MSRRGLIFRVFGLHSLRCGSCGLDVVYCRKFPTVCHWCGGYTVDFVSLSQALAMMKAMSDAMAEFSRTVNRTSTAFARLAAQLTGADR